MRINIENTCSYPVTLGDISVSSKGTWHTYVLWYKTSYLPSGRLCRRLAIPLFLGLTLRENSKGEIEVSGPPIRKGSTLYVEDVVIIGRGVTIWLADMKESDSWKSWVQFLKTNNKLALRQLARDEVLGKYLEEYAEGFDKRWKCKTVKFSITWVAIVDRYDLIPKKYRTL